METHYRTVTIHHQVFCREENEEHTAEFECDVTIYEEPAVWTCSNGDPGYPGSVETECTNIGYDPETDTFDLTEEELDLIAEKACEKAEI